MAKRSPMAKKDYAWDQGIEHVVFNFNKVAQKSHVEHAVEKGDCLKLPSVMQWLNAEV